MDLTWTDRLLLFPFLTDMRHWPVELPTYLPPSIYKEYQARKFSIHHVLSGKSPWSVARQFGINEDQLEYALQASLSGPIFTLPKLTLGLIPGMTQDQIFSSPLDSSILDKKSLSSCTLKILIELVPNLKSVILEPLRHHGNSACTQSLYRIFRNHLPYNNVLISEFKLFYSDEGFEAFHRFCRSVLYDDYLFVDNNYQCTADYIYAINAVNKQTENYVDATQAISSIKEFIAINIDDNYQFELFGKTLNLFPKHKTIHQ